MNKHIGTKFDTYLADEGLLDEVEAVAIKRVIAYELEKRMRKDHISKTEMAARMHTSRSALDRILNPENVSVTLSTLIRAAHVLGKKLRITLR